MLCVTLEGYFPVDGCKLRESFHSNTEDRQLACVQATQFVLAYHKGVVFTSILVENVDSQHRSYGRGIADGMQEFKGATGAISKSIEGTLIAEGTMKKDDLREKFPSEGFFKDKTTEHHAQQAQKVKHDPFTEAK